MFKYNTTIFINIILLLCLILFFVCFIRKNNIEQFEDRYNISHDIYDKQYVDIYDIVWIDKNMIEFIAKQLDDILFKNYKSDDKIKILDCGCGIGYYNNLFANLGYESIGIDKSKNMLRKSTIFFPKDTRILGDIINYELFKEKEFSHIYIGNYVLNQNSHKNINKIIKNCYYWLRNDGYLIVDIKDIDKLDYFPAKYSQYYIDNKGNKHSFTYYKNFLYDRFFLKDKEDDTYLLYEKIILSDNRERIIVNKQIIPKRDILIKLIETNGFKYEGIIEDDNYKNGNGFDIVIFKKQF